jgi:hypothetical protein
MGSCLVDDPNHCVNKEGHASCTEAGFPFCSRCVKSIEHGGCVAEAPTEEKCEVEDGGVAGTIGSDGTSMTDATATMSDDGVSTGPDCTAEGAIDEACPATTPYCVGGTCSGCDVGGDGFCAEVDATLPVCGVAGTCVECSAESSGACADIEFCSPAGVCGGCTSHDQCAPAGCETDPSDTACQACNFESGECFDGNVFWVSLDDCVGPEPTGTFADPYCQISEAMANVANFETFTVWVLPSRTPYAGPVNLQMSGNYRVAVIGRDGRPTVSGSNYAANVSTTSNRLTLSSLALENGTESTARCASGRLWLDDVIVRAGPIGVSAEGCALLSVSRSVITGADEIGISATDSGFRMVNSSVVNNGSDALATAGGITLSGSEDWTIDYSTVVANFRESTTPGNAIACEADSRGDARNSIFLSAEGTNAIDCEPGEFSYTVSDITDLPGDGNMRTTYMPADFDNAAVGDAHLDTDADPATFRIAVWRDGDPPTDVDGELRPLVDGAADWAGFDLLP